MTSESGAGSQTETLRVGTGVAGTERVVRPLPISKACGRCGLAAAPIRGAELVGPKALASPVAGKGGIGVGSLESTGVAMPAIMGDGFGVGTVAPELGEGCIAPAAEEPVAATGAADADTAAERFACEPDLIRSVASLTLVGTLFRRMAPLLVVPLGAPLGVMSWLDVFPL